MALFQSIEERPRPVDGRGKGLPAGAVDEIAIAEHFVLNGRGGLVVPELDLAVDLLNVKTWPTLCGPPSTKTRPWLPSGSLDQGQFDLLL